MERKEILNAIQKELSRGLFNDGTVYRIDNVFFRCKHSGCVQRDVVYTLRRKFNFQFDLLSLDCEYFTGSKSHALALQEALGGKVFPSEYVAAVNSEDIWIWEGPHYNQNPEPLELKDMKQILFDS